MRWQNRTHFFAISARLMRRILVDHARKHQFAKRGGGAREVSFDETVLMSKERSSDLVALDEALTRLAEMDSRKAQVVEMRFFGGMSVEETAEALAVSQNTVKRDWSTARAWLYTEVTSGARP